MPDEHTERAPVDVEELAATVSKLAARVAALEKAKAEEKKSAKMARLRYNLR